MHEHLISDDLYAALRELPAGQLIDCALSMRSEWIENPQNNEAFIGSMVISDVLLERHISLPALGDDEKTRHAIEHLSHFIAD